jgi:hypothetical protein
LPERRYEITGYLGPGHDLYHLSKVLTGLIAGSQNVLRFKPVADATAAPVTSAAVYALVKREGKAMDIAFDLYDRSDRFDAALLEHSDIYFKRSFYEPHLAVLPVEWRNKVAPLGLNYACKSARGEALLAEAPLGLNQSLNRYRTVRPAADFEQAPDASVVPSIVFLTRAWAPESTSDDAREVNESRARIIRALRRAFPGRFSGGFAPNPFACQRYPDLVSEHPNEPADYLRFTKRHLIGVSTRGLHKSEPFKLAEYMAASLAIVSEPVRNEFFPPLTAGSNLLEFRTPEECVESCGRILGSPALAAELREASWRYYQSHVEPARHIENLLNRAFESETKQ